jgi:signal transduction histidine kinase
MIKTFNILRHLPIFRLKSLFKNELYRKEFFNDINYININRLKVFSYFILALVIFLLISDIFLKEFWKTGQIDQFMFLDIILGVVAIIVFYVTNFKAPKSSSEIRPWIVIFVHFYLLFHLIWGSAVSIVESSTTNNIPTFYIVVFSASIIFIIQGWIYIILLLLSLIYLLTGFYFSGMGMEVFVTHYLSIFVLVIIAWMISKALFTTRLRTFIATKDLEDARNSLDITVKERTSELELANEKLTNEINERKKYEKILEREKKRALEADSLKSIFLANMSHEIRTPLNGILGFSDLLHNPAINQEKKERYLNIINSNGQQLLKIIDDILDISMIESNQLKTNKIEFNLSHLFPDTLEFFKTHKQSISKDHISLICDDILSETNDRIFSDPTRIQQVLYNLLNNSFKFTDEGFVKFGGRVDDGFAIIYVEDSGIGIDTEIRKTIFKRFRQGDESVSRVYGGTGLGLSISKGIIELLDGMIWYDLTYSKGARFCFSVPQGNSDHMEYIPHGRKDFEVLRKKRILLVENEYNEFNFIAEIFKNLKITIYRTEFSKISVDFKNFNADLIIIDTNNLNNKSVEYVSQIKTYSNNALLFTILSENVTDINELINAGSTKVFFRPLNIQLLLINCLDLLNKRPSGQ